MGSPGNLVHEMADNTEPDGPGPEPLQGYPLRFSPPRRHRPPGPPRRLVGRQARPWRAGLRRPPRPGRPRSRPARPSRRLHQGRPPGLRSPARFPPRTTPPSRPCRTCAWRASSRVTGEVVARPPDTVNPKLATGEVEVEVAVRRGAVRRRRAALPGRAGQRRRRGGPAHVPLPRHAPRARWSNGWPSGRAFASWCAPTSPAAASSRCRPPSSPCRHPKAPGTTSCRAGCTRESSTPCPRRPSSSSSCSWSGASSAISRSPRASGTRRRAPTAARASSTRSTWKWPSPPRRTSSARSSCSSTGSSRRCSAKKAPAPYPRLSYADALARYGTDKPDLRFGLEIADLTAELGGRTELPMFAEAPGSRPRRPGAAGTRRRRPAARSWFDAFADAAKAAGSTGSWLQVPADGSEDKGPLSRKLTDGGNGCPGGRYGRLPRRRRAHLRRASLGFAAERRPRAGTVLAGPRARLDKPRLSWRSAG